MKFKIGDTVKGITFGTFGHEAKEGKIVEINEYNPTCMYAIRSDGYKWHLRTETVELIENEPIPVYIKNELNNDILLNKKEENTMTTLAFKEGQTFVCKRDDIGWWTKDKEYKVVFDKCHGLVIVDDDGCKWDLPNDKLLNDVFKLKEKIFDLNTLTTAQLREYIGLLEDKEDAENLLNEFIERMTK